MPGLDSHETSPAGRPTQSGPETGSEFPHPTRAGPVPAGPKHLIGSSPGLDHVDNNHSATTQILLPVMFTRRTTGE